MGKKNGQGKEYNDKNELVFEGEYLQGDRWNGRGKEYYFHSDEISFNGTYLNGEKKNRFLHFNIAIIFFNTILKYIK